MLCRLTDTIRPTDHSIATPYHAVLRFVDSAYALLACLPAWVFEEAVRWITSLRPSFVVSIGGLTQGKGTDTDALKLEWDQFFAHI